MCNTQCRVLCCVVPGTKEVMLSLLLFSCEVGAVKYALLVCQDTWRQYTRMGYVYRVCCMLSVMCQGTVGMQIEVRLCMHDACPKPNGMWAVDGTN